MIFFKNIIKYITDCQVENRAIWKIEQSFSLCSQLFDLFRVEACSSSLSLVSKAIFLTASWGNVKYFLIFDKKI